MPFFVCFFWCVNHDGWLLYSNNNDSLSHRKVHVFSSAKNNTYLVESSPRPCSPTDISRNFAAISLSPNIRQPMAIGTGWLQNSGWRASAADRPAKPPKWAMLCVPTPQAPKTSTLVSLVRGLNSMARLLWFEELIAVQTKKTHRRDVDQPLHLTFTWPYLILSDWKSLQLCIYLL